MENNITNKQIDKPDQEYCQDFKNMKFTGTATNPMVTLIIN